MDPGLVYDIGTQDYIDFLCGLGYTANQMSTILISSQWSCENRTTLRLSLISLTWPLFCPKSSSQGRLKMLETMHHAILMVLNQWRILPVERLRAERHGH
ncbi:hypothetical protein HanPI659440_Chr02g0041841 [Helianthus annuus]|nr:hypothetical protein HanIR_Chr02g0062931 [Helianthus annuus]KAJ0804761.1 hypothetical protein HanPI659440_Chr02g0041841 [Helianthus annuus]